MLTRELNSLAAVEASKVLRFKDAIALRIELVDETSDVTIAVFDMLSCDRLEFTDAIICTCCVTATLRSLAVLADVTLSDLTAVSCMLTMDSIALMLIACEERMDDRLWSSVSALDWVAARVLILMDWPDSVDVRAAISRPVLDWLNASAVLILAD